MLIMKVAAFIPLLIVLTSCNVGQDAFEQVESFGPHITNECGRTVVAAIAKSASAAAEGLEVDPIPVPPGARATIAFELTGPKLPDRLFLAAEVDGKALGSIELSVNETRAGGVEITVPSTCDALIEE